MSKDLEDSVLCCAMGADPYKGHHGLFDEPSFCKSKPVAREALPTQSCPIIDPDPKTGYLWRPWRHLAVSVNPARSYYSPSASSLPSISFICLSCTLWTTRYPRSFVPGIYSLRSLRARDEGCSFIFGGSADYLWGRCRCHRPTSTTTTLPLLIHLPYPRPALIVSARLHLPIRTLLLRAGTAHALPYRRTCTSARTRPSPTRASSPALDGEIWVPMLMRALRHDVLLRCRRPWPTPGEDPAAGVGAEISPPIWDAYAQGQAGKFTYGATYWCPAVSSCCIGPRVGGRGEVGYAPALLLGPVFWSRSPRGSGDVDVPLLREDVVKGERGEGGSNGEQRVNPARVKAPALLHFGPVESSMSALSRGSAIGDIGAWTWTAACSCCVLLRRRVSYEDASAYENAPAVSLLAIPHSYLDGEETQTPMSLQAQGTYSTPAHTSHLPSSTWLQAQRSLQAYSTPAPSFTSLFDLAPSSTLASRLTRRPRPRFTSPLRLGSKLNARFKAYSTPAPSFHIPSSTWASLCARSSKLNARFKAYSTPAHSSHLPSATQDPFFSLRLAPNPDRSCADQGSLPPFCASLSFLTWCGARAGRCRRRVTLPKLEARTDAGGDIDEDEDVRHGVQDHIDIDAERCRGFGGGHEDGRRHAGEYSVLTIDTRSPLSWILRERGGQGGPHSSRSDIDMYAY
ncbi:hypothetical protein B0H14DRAFT_3906603 [Mycena olivaceomarginata]|nr:hypothetical protein B0H14DRAFT_3906603 [Mycena olivaceomarginata]